MIGVIEPGAFTTVQDLGRPGSAAAGVPPSGAFDALSLRVANELAGNPEGAAALEITMAGPLLAFETDAVVAIAGALIEHELDGKPMPPAAASLIRGGSRLRLGRTSGGLRSYLAVRGGFSVPKVLGSSSTLVSAGFGGLLGRPLAGSDHLDVGASAHGPLRRLTRLPVDHDGVVRAVPGPQDDAFTPRGRDAFFSQPFAVSPRSDRAGVRLAGEPIELAGPADLDPEGLVTGAVQVPADGMPIVLGPDRPVTGGYVKIATVITADLPKIAQARPGDTLRFVEVEVEQARAAWREQQDALGGAIEDIA
jgi:antagonist of KipI